MQSQAIISSYNGTKNENVVCQMAAIRYRPWSVDTKEPSQRGNHFVNDIFKCTNLIKNIWTSINVLLKFIHQYLIVDKSALVQIILCHRTGGMPLSESVIT